EPLAPAARGDTEPPDWPNQRAANPQAPRGPQTPAGHPDRSNPPPPPRTAAPSPPPNHRAPADSAPARPAAPPARRAGHTAAPPPAAPESAPPPKPPPSQRQPESRVSHAPSALGSYRILRLGQHEALERQRDQREADGEADERRDEIQAAKSTQV